MTRVARVSVWLILAGLVGCSSGEPADRSLSVEEYTKLGMAPVDRPWSGNEMATAGIVIQGKLQFNHLEELPRYQSPRTGAIFARLTSVENLAYFKDKNQPLDPRFPQALNYSTGLLRILVVYVDARAKGFVGDREMVEVSGHTLRFLVVMRGLSDEFLPTLDKNDDKYANRMAALAQLKRGVNGQLTGVLDTLAASQTPPNPQLSRAERLRLLGYLKETLPDLFDFLPLPDREDYARLLQKARDDTRYADIQPAIGELEALARDLLKQSPAH
jgi:hypothetical protein